MSPKSTKPKETMRRWRIILVRAKGQRLGTVEAPDVDSAIKIAIAEFSVAEAQRSRLIAQPVE